MLVHLHREKCVALSDHMLWPHEEGELIYYTAPKGAKIVL